MVREVKKGAAWPGQAVALGLAGLLLLFLLPLFFLSGEEPRPEATPLPTATLPVMTPTAVSPVPGWDGGQTIRLLRTDGEVETLTLRDYLWGVVAAEMPASFELEALKAQAVCARTYCIYQREEKGDKHPGADVCGDYTCCQAYLTRGQAQTAWGEEGEAFAAKVDKALGETDGLLCLYGGAPIDAVFFSSTAGRTAAAAAVWGAEVPYLVPVDSPEGEEVPGWRTLVSFTPAEFSARFREHYPAADFSGAPETWIRDLTADDSGLVTSLTIGGVSISGGQARQVLGLRSARFTVEAASDKLDLWVMGYGHGVGMSQYGANAMAAEGADFEAILKWYYTGIEVASLPR